MLREAVRFIRNSFGGPLSFIAGNGSQISFFKCEQNNKKVCKLGGWENVADMLGSYTQHRSHSDTGKDALRGN